MASKPLKEFLREESASWYADGLIERSTFETLQERWDASAGIFSGLVRTLGVSGALIGFFGILGFATAMTESEAFAVLVLMASGATLTGWALRLQADPLGRFVHSAKSLLLLGMVLVSTGLAVLFHLLGLGSQAILALTGLVVLPLQFFLAYRFGNSWLLGYSVLGLFHWAGAWQSMLGRSTYGIWIEDPKAMAVVATAAVVAGVGHDGWKAPCAESFGKVWKVFGLVYLNLCLLIESLRGGQGNALAWGGFLAVLCLAQIAVGARRHDALFRGFGIVFLAIDIYTRFHESFWDRLELGTYFLAGGVVLLATGVALEAGMRWVEQEGGRA